MNSQIIIRKPYVICENNVAKLCSEIEDDGKRTLYYEVDKEYEKNLVVENSDTFVLGLLHHAMNVGKDIVCEVGVTEQLLFQLENFYIPVLSKNMPDLHYIKIIADPLKPIEHIGNGVVTGNSGGVDSFYTILKYINETKTAFKLTHLIFNNISTEDSNDKRIREVFEKDTYEKNAIAEELGLVPINLYSNLYSFYKCHFIYNYYYAAQYASAIFAIAKMFSVYYFSSGDTLHQFSIDHDKIDDGSDFDLFSLNCFSIKNLKIYSAGIEANRSEKMKAIIYDNCVKKHLQVCAKEQYEGYYKSNTKFLKKLNCGTCRKCRRTISMLYSDNLLDEYEDIFDLTNFRSNPSKYIGYELATDHRSYTKEIERKLIEKEMLPKFTIIWKILWMARFRITKIRVVRFFISKIRKY